jgi:hypothetical protein
MVSRLNPTFIAALRASTFDLDILGSSVAVAVVAVLDVRLLPRDCLDKFDALLDHLVPRPPSLEVVPSTMMLGI